MNTAPGQHNPLKTGIYSVRDYVRDGDEQVYANTLIDLMNQLSPEGILEETFAAEIMRATWRLRRCGAVEAKLGQSCELDPMVDEKTERQQKSVDRARAQSHYLLRRSIAELGKLQTNRAIRVQRDAGDAGLGVADLKQVLSGLKICEKEKAKEERKSEPAAAPAEADAWAALSALADKQLCQQYREHGMASFTQRPGLIPADASAQTQNGGQSFCNPAPGGIIATEFSVQTPGAGEASFCKPAAQPKIAARVSRNAPCPCGSGTKYKRCCGNPARPATAAGIDRAA